MSTAPAPPPAPDPAGTAGGVAIVRLARALYERTGWALDTQFAHYALALPHDGR